MNNKELTELKIEQPDNMEAIEHAFDEVIKDLILLREHVTGFEDARKYDPKHTAGTVPFETTPSNDEIKREVGHCRLCNKETHCVYNINLKAISICESCGRAIAKQELDDMFQTQKENNE